MDSLTFCPFCISDHTLFAVWIFLVNSVNWYNFHVQCLSIWIWTVTKCRFMHSIVVWWKQACSCIILCLKLVTKCELKITDELYVSTKLWRCWLDGRKGIWPVKNWVVGCWCCCVWIRVQTADMAQLMPLPLTACCSSKSRLVLPICCRLITRVVPGKIQEGHKTIVCMGASQLVTP